VLRPIKLVFYFPRTFIQSDRLAVGWVELRNPKSSSLLWFKSDRILGYEWGTIRIQY